MAKSKAVSQLMVSVLSVILGSEQVVHETVCVLIQAMKQLKWKNAKIKLEHPMSGFLYDVEKNNFF